MRKVEEIVGKVTVKQTKLSFVRPNAFAFDAVIAVLQNSEFSQPGLIVWRGFSFAFIINSYNSR